PARSGGARGGELSRCVGLLSRRTVVSGGAGLLDQRRPRDTRDGGFAAGPAHAGGGANASRRESQQCHHQHIRVAAVLRPGAGAGCGSGAAAVRERRGAVDDRRRHGLLSSRPRSRVDRSPLPGRLGRDQNRNDPNAMTTLADLRREYASRALDEKDAHADPMQQFAIWFDEALSSQLLDVNAMTLATASTGGEPSARIVLLKGSD